MRSPSMIDDSIQRVIAAYSFITSTMNFEIAGLPSNTPRKCPSERASSVNMSAQPGQSCSPTPRFWYSAHAASISSRGYSAIVVPPRRVPGAYRDRVDVEVAGRVVNLSSPDKVMFPEPGLTKLDVVDF